MKRLMMALMVFVFVATIFGAPTCGWSDDEERERPEGTEIIFDLAIARPLGFVGLTVGTSVFIAAFPFILVVGKVSDAADALVAEPYRFTFIRDLGSY